MSDRETALFANAAFYAAFGARDMARLERLWGEGDVTCIHPGWPPLKGREAVMGSWKRIVSSDGSPRISCRKASATVRGTTAIVTCIEIIKGDGGDQALAATNIFVRTEDGKDWRMVHHQAGPAHIDPNDLEDDETPAMN